MKSFGAALIIWRCYLSAFGAPKLAPAPTLTRAQSPLTRMSVSRPFSVSTDFFVKRKKVGERTFGDMSPCHHAKSPIPAEQTPRKRIR